MPKFIAVRVEQSRRKKEDWLVAREEAGGDKFRFIVIAKFSNERDALSCAKLMTQKANFEFVTGEEYPELKSGDMVKITEEELEKLKFQTNGTC